MRNAVYIIIAILLFFASCKPKVKNEYYSIFKEDLSELCEGDLVFRKGLGTATRLVNLADKNTIFSHIGILMKDVQDNWLIVHAVPGEQLETGGKEVLKIDSVNVFFQSDRALAGAVYRLPMNEDKVQKIKREIIRLAEREIYFDHSFNIDDTTKFYCTELIHFIFSKVGEDITEGRKHSIPAFQYELIFPSDILENKNLIEIYNF